MAISKDNIRFLVTVSKEMKAELERIAEKENRSLNNLISTTLKKYIEEYKKIEKDV